MPSATGPSRSPSPVTAPPVAAAPGPRAQALQNIFVNALDATLKKCSYNNFADCFPTPAKYVPETLDALHRQFIARLGETCKENFDAIIKQRNVVPSLNELDRLLEDATKRKEAAERAVDGNPMAAPVPLHTLSPETLFHSHLHPFLTSHTASLSTDITTLQDSNVRIFEEIKNQRNEVAGLVKNLEDLVAELEKGAQTLEEGIHAQGLPD